MCEGCDGEIEDRDEGICVVDSFLGIAGGFGIHVFRWSLLVVTRLLTVISPPSILGSITNVFVEI